MTDQGEVSAPQAARKADGGGTWYSSNVRKKGYLQKMGGMVKSVKDRYFLLTDDALFYFVTEEDSRGGRPQGVIPMHSLHAVELCNPNDKNVKKDAIGFYLKTSGRTFIIYCSSKDDRMDWMQSILTAKEVFNKTLAAASTNENNPTSGIGEKSVSALDEWDVFAEANRNIVSEANTYGAAVQLGEYEWSRDKEKGDEYLQWKVETTCSLPDILRSSKCSVMRRYQDLTWLHVELSKLFVDVIIPPLHGRVKVSAEDVNSIRREKTLIETFLTRCVRHPQILRSEPMKLFLEAKLNVLDIQKSSKTKKEVFGQKFHNFMNKMSMKRSGDESPNDSPKSEATGSIKSEPWVDEKTRSLFEKEKLYRGLTTKSEKFSSAIISLDSMKNELVLRLREDIIPTKQELTPFINCVESCFQALFGQLSEVTAVCAMDDVINDISLQIKSAQAMLGHRADLFEEWQDLVNKHIKQDEKIASAVKKGDKKIKALQDELPEIDAAEVESKKKYDDYSANAQKELNAANDQIELLLSKIFKKLVCAQGRNIGDVYKTWERVSRQLTDVDIDDPWDNSPDLAVQVEEVNFQGDGMTAKIHFTSDDASWKKCFSLCERMKHKPLESFLDLWESAPRLEYQIPRFVAKCFEAINASFANPQEPLEGLFRISSSQQDISLVRDRIEMGEVVFWGSADNTQLENGEPVFLPSALNDYKASGHATVDVYTGIYIDDVDLKKEDPHVVAALLKTFLRELPEPLCTLGLFPEFVALQECSTKEDFRNSLILLLEKMPLAHRVLLRELCLFLKKFADNAERTKMHVKNLATVIGPNVFRDNNDDPLALASTMGIVHTITETLINEADNIFPVHPVDPWDFRGPDNELAVACGVVLHEYVPKEKGELKINVADQIYILSKHEDGWADACVMTKDGSLAMGTVPMNYTYTIDLDKIPRRSNTFSGTVTRCYGDCKWLRRDLELAYPCGVVPHIVSKPFIKRYPSMRVVNIARFVGRMAGHPRFRRHPAFRTFLHPSLDDMGKRKGKGFGSFLNQHNLKGQSKELMDAQLSDVWVVYQQFYVQVYSRMDRGVRFTKALTNCCDNLPRKLSQLSTATEALATCFLGVASYVEKNKELAADVRHVARCMDMMSPVYAAIGGIPSVYLMDMSLDVNEMLVSARECLHEVRVSHQALVYQQSLSVIWSDVFKAKKKLEDAVKDAESAEQRRQTAQAEGKPISKNDDATVRDEAISAAKKTVDDLTSNFRASLAMFMEDVWQSICHVVCSLRVSLGMFCSGFLPLARQLKEIWDVDDISRSVIWPRDCPIREWASLVTVSDEQPQEPAPSSSGNGDME